MLRIKLIFNDESRYFTTVLRNTLKINFKYTGFEVPIIFTTKLQRPSKTKIEEIKASCGY